MRFCKKNVLILLLTWLLVSCSGEQTSPQLLLTVSKKEVDLGMCFPKGTTEIWRLQEPFDKRQILLSNPDVNYFAPAFSPNGEWIAYIESNPSASYLGEQKRPTPGHDVVWIMRANGSEKRQVSEYLDSVDEHTNHTCYPHEYIVHSLQWSLDGNYLHFIHNRIWENGIVYDNYIFDMREGESYFIGEGTIFEFSPDSNSYLIGDWENGYLKKGRLEDLPESELENLPLDMFAGVPLSAGWPAGFGEPYIRTRNDETNILWEYDPAFKIWRKLWEQSGSLIEVGQTWTAFFVEDQLMLIDSRSGSQHVSVPLKTQSYEMQAYLGFMGFCQQKLLMIDKNQNIWMMALGNSGVQSTKELFEWQSLASDMDYWLVIGEESWWDSGGKMVRKTRCAP